MQTRKVVTTFTGASLFDVWGLSIKVSIDMSQQVCPLEIDEDRLRSFVTGPDSSVEESIRRSHRIEVSLAFSPILKAMKFTGGYFGETALNSASRLRVMGFSRCYCAAALLGQWLLAGMATTSLVCEGLSSMRNFYFILVCCIWFLQCALFTTINMVVLPLTHGRESRFARFIVGCHSTTTEHINMGSKVKRGLFLACFLAVFNATMSTALDFYQFSSVAHFRPWNGLLVYRIVLVVFGLVDSFAWMLTVLSFCVTCSVLEAMFEHLHKKTTTQMKSGFLNIASFRKEFLKLCKNVALADSVFSPVIFALISLDIPLICVNFNQLVRLPLNESGPLHFLVVLYWGFAVSSMVTLIIVFGTRLHEKVGFLDFN